MYLNFNLKLERAVKNALHSVSVCLYQRYCTIICDRTLTGHGSHAQFSSGDVHSFRPMNTGIQNLIPNTHWVDQHEMKPITGKSKTGTSNAKIKHVKRQIIR